MLQNFIEKLSKNENKFSKIFPSKISFSLNLNVTVDWHKMGKKVLNWSPVSISRL
jgi:hypothetical protein